MLLGEPWYKKNDATHNYLTNTYTIELDIKYVLMAMEKKLFKTWRKKRLQKMKEQEKAKEKEAGVSEILVAPEQSIEEYAVEETDSKPRTVSLEERDDDMTTSITGEKKKNIILNVHALPREMCMCMHARKDSYTSTFDLFSFEPMEIMRRMCLHAGGVLINYYFHEA